MTHEHEDELRQRAEDGDATAADQAGIRELRDDELDDISGGYSSEMRNLGGTP